ncbi:MAG: hypothetical protein ACMXYB_01550, partial [Candidatus Woesearchaeota archaeon]
TNSLLIKDSNEEIVASFSSSNNNIYLKGKAAVQGEQAGCLPDGNYCNDNNNDILESRDYFCNLIGYKEGSCEYTVLSTQSCSSNDYFFCSGNNRHKMEYSCSGGSGSASCVGSPRFIQTCTYAPSTRTSSWSCSSSSTRSRTITTYSPTCSSGSCSYTSSRSTQRQNCGSGRHCSRGSCVRSRFAYEAEWRYVDGPHAGRGVRGSHRTHTANAPFSNAVCYTSTGAFRKGWIRWWPPGGAHVRCYIWGHRYI